MTHRQFGAYSVRIIGAQARITGPRGFDITGGPDKLRRMLRPFGVETDKRAALEYAVTALLSSAPE